MSAPKNDVELEIYNIVSIFTANLNAKLDAIAAEKGDSVLLPHVDTVNGYAVLTLDEKLMNADPIIFFMVDDIRTQSKGPASESQIDISCIIIKEDDGANANIQKTMLRYMRACSEVIEDNYSDLLSGGVLEVKSLSPRFLQGLNTSKPYRGAGVSITMPVSS